jgi:hypothetical protein
MLDAFPTPCALGTKRISPRWRAVFSMTRAGIGAARVRVADVGREEFEEAHRGAFTGGGDKRWQRWRPDRDELVHDGRITTGSRG